VYYLHRVFRDLAGLWMYVLERERKREELIMSHLE
jgi:hypothetical protein